MAIGIIQAECPPIMMDQPPYIIEPKPEVVEMLVPPWDFAATVAALDEAAAMHAPGLAYDLLHIGRNDISKVTNNEVALLLRAASKGLHDHRNGLNGYLSRPRLESTLPFRLRGSNLPIILDGLRRAVTVLGRKDITFEERTLTPEALEIYTQHTAGFAVGVSLSRPAQRVQA